MTDRASDAFVAAYQRIHDTGLAMGLADYDAHLAAVIAGRAAVVEATIVEVNDLMMTEAAALLAATYRQPAPREGLNMSHYDPDDFECNTGDEFLDAKIKAYVRTRDRAIREGHGVEGATEAGERAGRRAEAERRAFRANADATIARNKAVQ